MKPLTHDSKNDQAFEPMSFIDHIDELRRSLIKCIAALLIGSCFFYFVADKILMQLAKPVGRLVFTSVTEGFGAHMSLTFLGGFFIALPFILFEIWKFLAKGLNDYEKKWVKVFAPFSLVLFIVGGVFAYYVMLPLAMEFLLSFRLATVVPMISVSKYISFVATLVFTFGVVFELPLFFIFLTKVNVVTPDFLREHRRVAIVVVLAVSAFLTPPDIITQLLMGGPLIFLYEISVICSQIIYNLNKKKI